MFVDCKNCVLKKKKKAEKLKNNQETVELDNLAVVIMKAG